MNLTRYSLRGNKMFVVLRILIGMVLLVSGVEKTISPYQNFLYVIQAYQMLPGWLESVVAVVLPWVELLVGLFLVVGLWLPLMLNAALVIFAMFIVVVGQALLRGLPIDQCGCFGNSIHIAPRVIIIFDSVTLLLTYWLIRKLERTSFFSVDGYFRK